MVLESGDKFPRRIREECKLFGIFIPCPKKIFYNFSKWEVCQTPLLVH
jgi:hypothetical protein